MVLLLASTAHRRNGARKTLAEHFLSAEAMRCYNTICALRGQIVNPLRIACMASPDRTFLTRATNIRHTTP